MLARCLAMYAAVAVGSLGCMERTTLAPPPYPPPVSAAPEKRGPAKLHLRDGRLIVLEEWRVEGDRIFATGREYGVERDFIRTGEMSVALRDVALVETTRKQLDPAVLPMAVVTGVSVGLTFYCLLNIKACFGSCPTFYVPDDSGGWALQAEGFSSSIARIFEADDLDNLPDARPRGGAVTLAMRNEALETHLIRALSLEVVHGPRGASVLRGFRDGYLAVGPPVAPGACEGPDVDGAATCAALAARDGSEVALDSDGHDLATRTSITLRYPAPGKRDVALVLTARNSLMTTYVLYQMMALHGRALGDFMAAVERGDPREITALLRFDQVTGGIDVAFRQRGGAFQPAGSLGYIGPIARGTRGLAFSVDAPAEPVEVKLTFARSHWKLDAARLAPVLASDLIATDVPAEVSVAHGRDAAAVAASLRGEGPHVVTLPGDEIVFRFPVPAETGDASTGYFLHSRGYYYEWMRDEWLKDEDPVRARAYLDDPVRALRELAPAYHALEPSMESVFRASRFGHPASAGSSP